MINKNKIEQSRNINFSPVSAKECFSFDQDDANRKVFGPSFYEQQTKEFKVNALSKLNSLSPEVSHIRNLSAVPTPSSPLPMKKYTQKITLSNEDQEGNDGSDTDPYFDQNRQIFENASELMDKMDDRNR